MEEKPVPKSSREIRIPASVHWRRLGLTAAVELKIAVSVSSRMMLLQEIHGLQWCRLIGLKKMRL
jgi:hypothetical protein